MNLQTILALLPKVGPIIAAAPEFRTLINELVDTLASDRDQEELRSAYEHAISGADEAHEQLQMIVARNA